MRIQHWTLHSTKNCLNLGLEIMNTTIPMILPLRRILIPGIILPQMQNLKLRNTAPQICNTAGAHVSREIGPEVKFLQREDQRAVGQGVAFLGFYGKVLRCFTEAAFEGSAV